MWRLLVACGSEPDATGVPGVPSTALVDEVRELGRVDVAGRTFVWRASLRGWRHGWSFDPGAPHRPYDAVYVGWDVTSEARLVRGEVEQTWDAPSVDAGRVRFTGLALETCVAPDRAAFRLEPDAPWRILVPDSAGAAAGIATGSTCDEALAGAGSAARWRRDGAANPATCTHLYRLGRTGDAIRCLLREPPRNGTGRASRQDLPRAPDDPAWDTELRAVLDPAAEGDRSGFSPYRVRDLLRESRDRTGIAALAAGTSPDTPWQAAVVAEAVAADRVPALLVAVDRALAGDTPSDAVRAELILAALGELAPPSLLRPRMERALHRAAIARCTPPDRPEPERCADLPSAARDWLARHPPS